MRNLHYILTRTRRGWAIHLGPRALSVHPTAAKAKAEALMLVADALARGVSADFVDLCPANDLAFDEAG